MGYIKNHAIIVTDWDCDNVRNIHSKAKELFGDLCSDTVPYISNGGLSFFIAPDGSKEGWTTSDMYDKKRGVFIDWLEKESNCDYVEVSFGGDDNKVELLRNSAC